MIILICVLFVVVIILTAKILTMDARIFELEKAVQVTTPLSDKEQK